ncbi:sensor histidine kinase [Anaeromicropila herbilytica]|uniref:histidine kinase n=1 Tax=Anaeromicropila herbilytica TaxID=2785025 RepID=A0A7R7ID68_9FIRM|nr:HAMP domain-containing sensor histidine kinase [Anaeromicropila herbilytica]BCN29723.1 hypothetical protein bsdtb5_10180 [Anaeromicropila herbilytica]
MFKSIRRKLILLYTITTGLILTTVMILAILLSRQQLIKSKTENFQNVFFNLSKNIQMDNIVSHLWLSEMEIKNNLIIHIEENGVALTYPGAVQYETSRDVLVEKIKNLAKKDHINTKISPSSTNEVKSSIYELKGSKKEEYYGAVLMVPEKKGYRTLIILQSIGNYGILSFPYNMVFILLDILGILGFYIISRIVVARSLRQVEESRRRQNEFIAAASHELKSPLAVIQANASALTIQPEKAEHFSQGIENECRRMKSLIEDMLLLTMVDAKNWKMKNEWVDMDTIMIEMYELYSPLYKQAKKELELNLQEDVLPKLKGDGLRIKQILAVLIDNALSYSKENDTVILKSYSKKNQLVIEVIDHGIGVSEEKKKEIFERFYRVDTSRNDKNHFGLGLSIAKELVHLQGGNIHVKDTLGGGATFMIHFPVSKISSSNV